MSDDSEEKSLRPTDQKLRKAREKGQIANSQDFVSGAAVVAGILYLALTWPEVVGMFNRLLVSAADRIAAPGPADPLLPAAVVAAGLEAARYLAPLLAIVVLAAVIASVMHHKGVPFSLHPVTPDFNRINPGQMLARVFSSRNAAQFGLSLLKLCGWFGLAGLLIWNSLPAILAAGGCDNGCGVEPARQALTLLTVAAAALLVLAGLLDLPLQQALFRREQRMSHQELRRELKETIGNPEIRGFRRGEGRRMLDARPQQPAPSLLIHGTGISVALRYDPADAPVPIVVGIDTQSAAVRALRAASEAATPVFEDTRLALDLAASVGLGKSVRERHFTPIARLLAQARLIG